MKHSIYPLFWKKDNFSIKIFCSIPNVATGILLNAGKTFFVIDPGDGILRDLTKEITTEMILSISDIFISHGHHDHVGGLWSFLTYLKVMKKTTPLYIHYPKGCKEIESIYFAFKKVYDKDIPYQVHLKKISGLKSFKRKSVTIHPFPVIHKEIHTDGLSREVPALGYTFTFDKKKICYGGDTKYCYSLVKMAKGSDLAIIEAGHEDDDEPSDMHMTMEEAISIAESAKEYFLVHVPE